MRKLLPVLLALSFTSFKANAQLSVYHPIQRDNSGNLVHWYNANNHGVSYDHCLGLVWNFWKNVGTCCGGTKFYMLDHSYSTSVSGNKLGGDQFGMALSSWRLYYAYTGDTDLVKNMVYIADNYMAHSLSNSFDSWPDFPFPCNYTNPGLPVYDGDFLLGAGWTQPDKGGSIANELVTLYKITNNNTYLQQAVSIANTLAAKVQPGDASASPYPFKVNASDGSLPPVVPATWHYTTSLVPTLLLFEQLKKMNVGNTVQYDSATAKIVRWVKTFPLQNNQWGSFFEDIPVPSNTEINAVTMARYILEHPEWGNTANQDARSILDWTLSALGSHAYDTLGVTAIYEQSVDLKEAGSHTSRFAATELLYAQKTGDTSHVTQALRQLDWANYLCDTNGMVRFTPPSGTIWYTDGYGDYVRHYLRAMAAYPAIAPDNANHLLESSSVVTYINYQPTEIDYTTYDSEAVETLRLVSKPLYVKADGAQINEQTNLNTEGWTWTAYPTGGVLLIKHNNAKNIQINGLATGLTQTEKTEPVWQLYPNPSSGVVAVDYTNETDEMVNIDVSDVSGRSVKHANISRSGSGGKEQKETFDFSDLQKGIYFVQLHKGKAFGQKKLILIR